jgi:hypothetical protein
MATKTWQRLGSNMTSKTMARPKQDHGKTRASAWQDQSKCMARPQQVHGKHTARNKQTHGKIMARE